MSVLIYCDKCGRQVVLDKFQEYHRGDCLCGYTVTARSDSFGKMFYTYHQNKPPDLGISVQDGIGADDKFGGA